MEGSTGVELASSSILLLEAEDEPVLPFCLTGVYLELGIPL